MKNLLCKMWFELLLIGLIGQAGPCLGQSTEPEVRSFQVAAMRVQPRRWDKAHNFALLEQYAQQAATQGAQLVVTCEGFLDGYTSNVKRNPELTKEKLLESGEPIDGPWIQKIGALAIRLKLFLAVGFAERNGQQMFNSVVVVSPAGKIVLHYSKTHTAGELFNTPGTHLPVSQTSIGTLGALICYDRRFPEVSRILALKGAQVLIIPAYGTDGERNEALLRTRAWENSVWVVYVKQNQALIIKPNGTIVARDKGDGDQLVFAQIEIDDDVGSGDILQRRSPEFYREIIELESPRSK
ncbi:MAG: carbon-nitrogen hydrolase family protein [Planctomycetales bacterium]|nr:carbon-nitrogen hydrolase family protein [Planctomycetales bacterium]